MVSILIFMQSPSNFNMLLHFCVSDIHSFNEGGCSPKFLIIDDGWQQTTNEFHKEGEPHIEGTQ